MISRELFLQKRELPSKPVEVPGLGSICVRGMTAGERDRFEQLAGPAEKAGRRNYRALIVAFTACGSDGTRLFTEEDAADLAAQPAALLDPVAEAAAGLNGFGTADVDAAEKN